ncbi:MAG: PAS domain S-box protein [Candidatus Kapabacteria bacterium]|nr:PAS domain S-box protein [Ignavibacteriota bacterium]MCW5884624.1 PAS domain S-box protein [Candidatus Kapabacteria bacterium]
MTSKQKKVKKDDNTSTTEKQLAWYKSFFDNATDAVFIVQPETWSVLDANDYAAQILGRSRDNLLGEILPQFRRIFKLLNKTNSTMVLSELSLENQEGNPIMVEVSARFMRFEGQDLILAIARDVSEQHALTDKLVQADKLVLLGQLSAGVAHEIRNPLAAVNLNLQVLKRRFEPTAPEYEYIETALQGVDRISRIVEVTLNFSRPTMPDIKDLQLNSLIVSTLELVTAMIKRKDIKVELKFDENLPVIAADSKQIQQVLINLITNAADAIKIKGNIKIETYTEKFGRSGDGIYVVASISDNGIGILPEDLPKIFNPFFTRKADGTGLGLPITQRILHQHSGIIDVESSFGSGTTFYVKLPLPSEIKKN